MALLNMRNIAVILLLICAASLIPTQVVSQSVASVVTPKFFNSIKSNSTGCAGKTFYTRDAFLKAVKAFPQFGNSKPEIAAFFAHVTHETAHLCYVEDIDKSNSYCDPRNKLYPCVPRKKYYGRGPLQLTWNYNYGAAGRAIGFDGLRYPETVARDPVVAFKTALWFWMKNVRPAFNQSFGATIQKINGVECNGGWPAAVKSRVRYFTDYCNRFGVAPGPNLYC